LNQAQILDFKDVTREDVERLAQLITTAVLKVEGFKIQGQGFTLSYLHGQLQTEDLVIDYQSIRLDLMVTSTGGWTDPIGQLKAWLLDQLSGLASWIVDSLWGLVSPVLSGLSDLVNHALGAISGLWDWLKDRFQDVLNAFNQVVVQPILDALSWVSENLPKLADIVGSAIDSFTKFLAELPGKVAEAAKGIADWLWNTLKDAVSRFMDLINQAGQALAKLPELISQAASGVIDWLKQAVSNAIQGITDVISSIIDSVKAAVGEIGKYFEPLVTWLSKLGDLLKNAFDLISDFITGLPEKAKGFFDWLGEKVKEVADFIAHFPERITQLVSDVTGWIWEHLPDWVKTFLTEAPKALMQVGSAVTGFINAILKFPEWFPKWFYEHIAKPIVEGFKTLASLIWDLVPSWLKDAFTAISEFFSAILRAGRGSPFDIGAFLYNTFIKPLTDAFSAIGSWIWSALPDWVKGSFEAVKDFFKDLREGLKDFLKDPAGWIRSFLAELPEKVAQAFATAVQILQGVWDTVWGAIKWVAERVWEGLLWLADVVKNGVIGFVHWVIDAAKWAFNQVQKGLTAFFNWFYQNFIEKPFKALHEVAVKAFVMATEAVNHVSPIGYAADLWLRSLPGLAMVYLPVASVVGLAEALANVEFAVTAAPEGAGGGLTWKVNLGDLVRELVGWTKDTLYAAVSGIFIGLAMNLMEPYRYLYRAIYKKPLTDSYAKRYREVAKEVIGKEVDLDAVFELPSISDVVDFVRRYMPWYILTPEEQARFLVGKYDFSKVMDYAKAIGMLYGYPNEYVKTVFLMPNEAALKIVDRFGANRTIPLGMLFEQPTHSELMRMTQRDVLPDIPSMFAFASMRGFSKDLTVFSYLMTFKYPSFDKLWNFAMRSISGMLWFIPTEDIREVFKREAQYLKAGEPIPPKELNFQGERVFTALGAYLKWLEYSNFSWFTDKTTLQGVEIGKKVGKWTADSWLMWDIAADLPGKIDARWMAKWGLFDHLSKKANVKVPGAGESVEAYPNVSMMDIIGKVVEPTLATAVMMDLRPFCRLLQAWGVHPAWIPITAVAEAINALSDERTLLRTGFINLFKEGFWNYETIDKLLAGFFTASFAVEYYDIKTHKWKAGAINIPVKFLPAERALLELRALMDRALDVLRDFANEARRAYAENVIVSSNEFEERLKAAIAAVNNFFEPQIKSITGKELKVLFDEAYWKAYVHVLDLYRDVYTHRRVRYWVGRILTWSIYRVAYGWITAEDVAKLINTFAEPARLTELERKVLIDLIMAIAGMVKREAGREYIPTPSMLASLSEVVPEARKLIVKVFEARNVPEEWQPIWAKYVWLKPILDEVKSLTTAVGRLFEYGLLDKAAFTKYLEYLATFGFEQNEVKLIYARWLAEKQHRAFMEVLGTPRTVAGMAEYSPIARDFALSHAYKMIDAMPIDDATKQLLKKMWEEYVRVRPVYGEVRRYITELISDYQYGVISMDDFKKELEDLKKWGVDDYEIDFYVKLAEKRRARQLAREAQRAAYATAVPIAPPTGYQLPQAPVAVTGYPPPPQTAPSGYQLPQGQAQTRTQGR